MAKEKETTIITYIVYDKKTGRIVHRHRSFDVEKEEYRECDLQEIKKLTAADSFTMSKVTDQASENLDVIKTTELPEMLTPGHGGFLVDVKSKKIVKKPKLALSTEKTELVGDGKDKSVIEIKVLDDQGNVVENYNGTIKISTSRGKLSTKGGLVKIKKGVGSIILTAVNETVDRVKVTAQCLEGRCVRAGLDLEFL